ncbi:MAG TPA: PaaX family transcriptional regulator C-terminal domain-containing protein [Gaiellaceae bacterium]|nr:PaaX family transcriptional regulator C-terminal domain-containing protein [Gaiellaceae bacterium]
MSDDASALFEQRPQSLVVTLLGAYVYPDDRLVWSGGLVRLLGELGFSAGAARVALARLTRRDLLARVRSGRLVHYEVTPRTTALLHEGERRIFSLGRDARPAGEWTILSHAVPDERRLERGRLARRLRFLGFGSLQDGVWISPHDRAEEVTALLEELDLVGHAAVVLGRPAGPADLEALVARAWDVDGLAERYRAFELAFRRHAGRGNGLVDGEAFLVRTRLVHAFRQFPSLDPGLPDELVPTNGHRAGAVALFHDLYATLAEPAGRHFLRATAPPG